MNGNLAPGARRWFALLLAAACLTGCDRLGVIGRLGAPLIRVPELRSAGLELRDLSLTGMTLRLKVNVHNPNRFSLTIRNWDYDLTLNEVAIPARPLGEAFTIAGRESRIVEIPVEVEYEQVGAIAKRAVERLALSYEFESTVEVSTWLGTRSVPFVTSGVLEPPVQTGRELLEELLEEWRRTLGGNGESDNISGGDFRRNRRFNEREVAL